MGKNERVLRIMIKIEQYMRKYRGIPFQYGGCEGKGLDCIGFVYKFFVDCGVQMPESCEDATKDNYSDVYRTSDDRADELLLKYFDAMPGIEVHPMRLLAGDALVIKSMRTGHLFPAIYGGNGIAVSSFVDSYVRAFSISRVLTVVRARRIM